MEFLAEVHSFRTIYILKTFLNSQIAMQMVRIMFDNKLLQFGNKI